MLWHLTNQQSTVLINGILAQFFFGVSTSLQNYFYPTLPCGGIISETTWFLGIVPTFGAFFICTGYFFSKVIKKYVSFFYKILIAISGFTILLFSILIITKDFVWFTGFAFTLQTVKGIGAAGFNTCLQKIEKEDRALRELNFLQLTTASFGVGVLTGAPLGQLLYLIGGIQLPFYVIGIVFIIVGLMPWWASSYWRPEARRIRKTSIQYKRCTSVISIHETWSVIYTTTLAVISSSFLSFSLKVTPIAFTNLQINSLKIVQFTISLFCVGFSSRVFSKGRHILIPVGLFGSFIGLFIIGLPLVHQRHYQHWMLLFGVPLSCLGNGITYISGISDPLKQDSNKSYIYEVTIATWIASYAGSEALLFFISLRGEAVVTCQIMSLVIMVVHLPLIFHHYSTQRWKNITQEGQNSQNM